MVLRVCPQVLALALLAVACSSTPRPDVTISEAAAEDHPVGGSGREAMEELIRTVQPAVEEARRTYPEAKRVFEAGLPQGSHLFVTIRLWDASGSMEQVFVLVDAIRRGKIDGRIWSELETVRGYEQGQVIVVEEAEILDWTILDAEGREEGNYIGKLLDELGGTTH